MSFRVTLALSLVLVAAGCATKLEPPPKCYPVKGKITLANGDPLPVGTVEIFPARRGEGYGAGGYLHRDGTFELKAFGTTTGTTPGKYLLAVTPYNEAEHGPYKGKVPTFPNKYRDASTSEIVIEVKAQDNDLGTIVLKE